MTRWAYMTTECASLEEMNHYGADGWEFVGEVHVMVPDPEYEGQETSRRPMLFRRPATEGK